MFRQFCEREQHLQSDNEAVIRGIYKVKKAENEYGFSVHKKSI